MRKDIAIQYIATDKLKLNAKNPRKNDAAVDTVLKSIEKYGFKNPVIADSALVVYCGNTRLKAARKLGLPSVPVIVADDLTAKEIRELAIIDNKSSEIAEWDMDMLADELSDLDLDDFNLDFDIDEDKNEITEDTPPEVDEEHEPITKLGDIWQLGEHRLMCGDSTDKATVEKLMNGEKADMVFTDPPYGLNIRGGSKSNKSIAGDQTQAAIPFSFDLAVKTATKDDARFYFCGGELNLSLYEKLFDRYLRQLPRHIIWVKNGFTLKPNNYHNQYEIIYFGFKPKGGGADKWYSGRSEEEASDVWQIKRDAATTYLHPTQKPIELPSRAIRNSSPVGALIYEPFGGSGSTLIACEQLGRRCYTMELDPKYCDVIIKRWENLTGKKAVRYGTSS